MHKREVVGSATAATASDFLHPSKETQPELYFAPRDFIGAAEKFHLPAFADVIFAWTSAVYDWFDHWQVIVFPDVLFPWECMIWYLWTI